MKIKPLFLALMRPSLPFGLASTAILLGMMLPVFARPALLKTREPGSVVNIRSAPTTTSSALGYGLAGDRVEVLRNATGNDGYTWYYVKFNQSRAEGWVRSDLVTVLSAAESSGEQNVQTRPGILQPRENLASDRIEYFLEVALGNEFGASTSTIKKWTQPLRIKVNGLPTPEDMKTLSSVVQEVNALTNSDRIQIVDRNPNVQLYFVPETEFSRYEPNYQRLNYGFFWTRWDNTNTIYNANILITTAGVTQKERSHLIREEITQTLGLMRDSFRYKDSMFYQGWTDPTEYSEIDKAVIKLLYHPDIRPGMTRSQVIAALKSAE